MKDNKELILWRAVRHRKLDDVRRLVEEDGADPTIRHETHSLPPLHVACVYGWLDAVRYFVLERKADVESKDRFGNTALHCACDSTNSEPHAVSMNSAPHAVVRFLVERARSNVEAKNNKGKVPLHFASSHQDLETVEYLVKEAGADVDAKNANGDSPIHCAMWSGSKIPDWAVIRFLVSRSRFIDAEHLKMAWERDYPFDFKNLLMERFVATRLAHLPGDYWNRFRLHACLYSPLATESSILEVIGQFKPENFSVLDCNGCLPIHVVVASTNKKAAITTRVLEKILGIEPRAACVRDPRTGLFPSESVAILANKNEDISWLGVVYRMVRYDPIHFVTNRHGRNSAFRTNEGQEPPGIQHTQEPKKRQEPPGLRYIYSYPHEKIRLK